MSESKILPETEAVALLTETLEELRIAYARLVNDYNELEKVYDLLLREHSLLLEDYDDVIEDLVMGVEEY